MSFDDLIGFFTNLGVDISSPGFYDHPSLLELEQSGVDCLTGYARFVMLKPHSAEYLNSVRSKIVAGATRLNELMIEDGRLGACIDCSMSFSRMLDEFGIWNFCVKGALTLQFDDSSEFKPFHFWPVDEDDGSGREFGHKWVTAPPFKVIDLTLKLQDYPVSFGHLLPPFVMFDDAEVIEPSFMDVISPPALAYALSQGATSENAMFLLAPHLRNVFRTFPSYFTSVRNLGLRYVTCGFSASDGPLSGITALTCKGMTAPVLFDREIRPAMATD